MNYINEAVDLHRKIIFVAIPKTGTTSIRKQLQQTGKPLIKAPHLNIVQIRQAINLFFQIRQLGTNKAYPSANVKSCSDIQLESDSFFNNSFKFSSVRNPWERAVSLYSRKEGIQLKSKISFREFIEQHFYASDTCVIPTLHKNQYDWLCDEKGSMLADYVFKLENFREALPEIDKRSMGRLKLKELQENKNPLSHSERYREFYNDQTKNLIAKRFEKDIDYFKFSF
tara:strand:+ start:3435 stop:4115 length:681 start_codon:yes stop_codon:yes gene_type:complete